MACSVHRFTQILNRFAARRTRELSLLEAIYRLMWQAAVKVLAGWVTRLLECSWVS
jgi:hypothetical protein